MAAEVGWEAPGTRPRRWPAVVLLLLLGPPLAMFARGGIDPRPGVIPVEAVPTPDTPEPAASPSTPDPTEPGTDRVPSPPPLADGTWQDLGTAPISIAEDSHATWTGQELLVVSHGETGTVAAATFDLTREVWRELGDVPVRPAAAPAPVWTGSDVLVWGQRADRTDGRLAVAAYDPATGDWRLSAPGPLPAVRTGVAVWTGREALVWGTLVTGAKVASAYHPATDSWTSIPQAPVPPAARVAGTWTDRELVVWGEWQGRPGAHFAAAYDPFERSWRRLPPPPLIGPVSAAAGWTGRELVLWGSRHRDDPGGRPAGAALQVDDEDASWRMISPAPFEHLGWVGRFEPSVAWTGEHLAFTGGSLVFDQGWLYHPASDTWRVVAGGGGVRSRPVVEWVGDRLLTWGGHTRDGPSADLVAWEPGQAVRSAGCGTDHAPASATEQAGPDPGALPAGWSRSAAPPLPPLGSADGGPRWTAVVADRDLVLFDPERAVPGSFAGRRPPLAGATFDLDTGAWACLPDAPIERRRDAVALWTGEEVVVWGGHAARALNDGAAYHPRTRSWRRLPPAPVAGGTPYAAAWTGTEVLLWGLHGSPPGPGPVEGVAYDPATNRWREIAPAPSPLHRGEGTWTGTELLVVGAAPRADPTDVAQAAAYDPLADSWRTVEDSPFSPQASTVSTAGVAVIGWDHLLTAATYDRSLDRWDALPAIPMHMSECQPASAPLTDGALFAWYCGQAAVLDMAGPAWSPIELPASAGLPLVSGDGAVHALAPDGSVLTFSR